MLGPSYQVMEFIMRPFLTFSLQNTRETAQTIKHMHLRRAVSFLKNVKGHKECVPFRRYNGGIGRCAQVGFYTGIFGTKTSSHIFNIYFVLEFVCGICCCHVNFLALPNSSLKVWPCPTRNDRHPVIRIF